MSNGARKEGGRTRNPIRAALIAPLGKALGLLGRPRRSVGAALFALLALFVGLGAIMPVRLIEGVRAVIAPGGVGAGVQGAGSAALDTVLVVGPLRLVAASKPQHHVERFTVEPLPGVRHRLVLEADGTPPSGAEVRLNGALLFSNAEYEAEVVRGAGRLVRTISLAAENTLEVTVRGGPGRALVLSIVQEPDPSFIVFGPVTYVRQAGSPNRAIEQFTLPAAAAPPYALHIENGANGGGRVTSAEVRLNGRQVAGPSDFNSHVGGFTRDVDLEEENTLEVELRGAPGSALAIWITATDTASPRLELTSPADGQLTNGTEIEVSGRVEDETPVRVEVNGEVVAVTNGAFSHTVPLASEGENTIIVTATDAAGNRAVVMRTVIRDTEAPGVSWTSPEDGRITRDDVVRVEGTATDRTEVSVSVNGLPLVVQAGGIFSGEVTLAEGENVLVLVATDAAGNQTSLVRQVVKDSEPPLLEVTAPEDGAAVDGESVAVSGRVQDRTSVTLTVNGQALEVAADGTFSGTVHLAEGETTLTFTATDAAGNTAMLVRTVVREPVDDLPPDPAEVAPPLDPTVATNIATATAFLYTGDNPIQKGVAPGTIEPRRAAVVRGRVLTREGEPLPGVKVTVHGHPEFGYTLSRTDGWYDLAVNGGGTFALHFERSGYLSAQRPVDVPWQDYALADDVALVALDTAVTTIDLAGATEVQVARASVVEDEDGPRQATLLFEPGTEAVMVLPDGSEQPLSTLSVRVTEYTVGEGGKRAMPAPLPPQVAYTYAAELSVDEALAAGAKTVRFSKPVPFYIENFLSFPTGTPVPLAYYDYDKAAWVPMDNGRIIEVVDTAGGVAAVDIDGDGIAEEDSALEEFGMTLGERERLASLYAPGQSLWRMPVPHFSPIDGNYPAGFGPWGEAPNLDTPVRGGSGEGDGGGSGGDGGDEGGDEVDGEAGGGDEEDEHNCETGSIIDCENQALGERIPIAGTPYTLNYLSTRMTGRSAARSLSIQLSGESVPDSARYIALEIEVAGRKLEKTFPAEPNQRYVFTWDGKDAYGREVNGEQSVHVRVGYAYQQYYYVPADQARSFGLTCEEVPDGPEGMLSCIIPQEVNSRVRQEGIYWQSWQLRLGYWDARGHGALGGWTLDVHHGYDAVAQIAYFGDGSRVSASHQPPVITPFAGNGERGWDGVGGPALEATFSRIGPIAVGPDGTVYVAEWEGEYVRRIDPNGVVHQVVSDEWCDELPCGDGGPAIEAALYMGVEDLEVGPDGSLYILDATAIRKIDPNGIITTVAGGYDRNGYSGDGGPATEAGLDYTWGMEIAPDGTIYTVESARSARTRIRKISPDGTIHTIAGGRPWPNSGVPTIADGFDCTQDSIPAALACLDFASDIALAPDGSLYVLESEFRLLRITPDGMLIRVAGGVVDGEDIACRDAPDGTPATRFGMCGWKMAAGPDGKIYVHTWNGPRILAIEPDGYVVTVVGKSTAWGCPDLSGPCGDFGPAREAFLEEPHFAFGPDGALYIADVWLDRVRKVAPPLPGSSLASVRIPASNGSEVYEFDISGRHLRTVDGKTLETLLTFRYDEEGRLAAVVDADGLTTTIERASDGTPTAIIAPFGQRTSLEIGPDGLLAGVIDPAGNRTRFAYGPGGLLEEITDPNGHTTRYAYSGDGLLRRVEDAAGGVKELTRSVFGEDGYEVTSTSPLGRMTRYRVETLPDGTRRRTVVDPAGLETATLVHPDGVRETVSPDGTTVTLEQGPDPRFGMLAPVTTWMSVRTPGGLELEQRATRTTVLGDPANPFGLAWQVDSAWINGRAYVAEYNVATGTLVSTTPSGRASLVRLDRIGRVLRDSIAGLLAIENVYDERGFLTEVRQGGRTATFGFDGSGRLAAITDPLGRTDSLFYDLAGRLVRQKFADGREMIYSYDAAGNLTSLTPPGRGAHVFTYTALDQPESYMAPDVGVPTVTRYRYDLDRQLTHILRPGGDSIVFAYDSAGRPSAINFDRGLLIFGYHPTTATLQTITAPGGNVLSYTYDGSLPLRETWSGEVSGSVSVVYNNDFRVSSQTVAGTSTITFAYDDDGLLTRAGSLTIERRPDNGLVSGTTLGQVSTEQGYSGFGELGHLAAHFGGSELYWAEYTRDDLGRITALTEAVQGVTSSLTFAYDESGRLKQVTRDGLVVEAYEYDANGNRLRATYPTGTVVGTYDAQDRLVSYGGATYTFAPSGELALKVEGSDTTRYTYDQLGNLVRVELPDGREIEYVIDGRNRRVGRKVDGVLTHGWLYQDQFNPVAELDASGNVVARFVYGTRPNVPDYMVRGGRTYRFITDHLGSVRLVVDVETGVVVQRLDYDAYGRVLLDTNPGFQPFGFAGGIYDPATGLVRFGARDYDPHTGRWTSKDPIGFEGGDPNLYGYVLGDPVNLVDPDGYLPLPIALSLLGGGINGAFRAISAALGCSDENVWSAFGKGFLSGALGTAASLPVGGRLITYGITALAAGAVGGFAEAFVGDVLLGDDVSFSDYIWSTGMGALGGRAGHSAFRINPGWAVPDWWAWRPPRKWTSYPRKLAGQEATSGMVEGAGSLLNDCLCK